MTRRWSQRHKRCSFSQKIPENINNYFSYSYLFLYFEHADWRKHLLSPIIFRSYFFCFSLSNGSELQPVTWIALTTRNSSRLELNQLLTGFYCSAPTPKAALYCPNKDDSRQPLEICGGLSGSAHFVFAIDWRYEPVPFLSLD